MVEEAELDHEIAELYGGGGNREYESTKGGVEALAYAEKFLTRQGGPHPIDELDELIAEARENHEKADKQCLADGSRLWRSTYGAQETLRNARETLRKGLDDTRAKMTGYIYKHVFYKSIGPLRIPSVLFNASRIEFLHIGDKTGLEPEKCDLITYRDHEIIKTLEGTRTEIMNAFLDKYSRKRKKEKKIKEREARRQ